MGTQFQPPRRAGLTPPLPFRHAIDMDVEIDTSALAAYAATLQRAAAGGPRLQSAILNNLAFGARDEALRYIPTVMHVRNKAFLSASLLVRKSTSTTLRAEFYSKERARYTALAEQEFGGVLHRHPATKAARGGTEQGTMRQQARLRGDIISPEDVQIAHDTGTDAQFFAVYMKQLATGKLGTGGAGQRFIMHKRGAWRYPGLKRLGKLAPKGSLPKGVRIRRQVIGLQQFNSKERTKVQRRPWMWVSVQKYMRALNMDELFNRTLSHLMANARRVA